MVLREETEARGITFVPRAPLGFSRSSVIIWPYSTQIILPYFTLLFGLIVWPHLTHLTICYHNSAVDEDAARAELRKEMEARGITFAERPPLGPVKNPTLLTAHPTPLNISLTPYTLHPKV